MNYLILERHVRPENGGGTILFKTLMTPYDGIFPVRIEAETLDEAATKAAEFLNAAGLIMHCVLGEVEYPFFFVARTVGDDGVLNSVYEFAPVKPAK